MGVLEQLVEGERFGGVLSHTRFQFLPVARFDRRHAEIFAGPDLMLVQCLMALIERAERGDRRGRQAEPLADIAQQLARQCADMIERVATGTQKDQLDRDASTAIAPKTLVDRGNVAKSVNAKR